MLRIDALIAQLSDKLEAESDAETRVNIANQIASLRSANAILEGKSSNEDEARKAKTKGSKRADEDKLNDDDDDDDGDEDDEEDGDEDDEEDEEDSLASPRTPAKPKPSNRDRTRATPKPNTKRLKALLTATQRALLSATSAPDIARRWKRSRSSWTRKTARSELVRDIDHPAVTTGLSLSIGRWRVSGENEGGCVMRTKYISATSTRPKSSPTRRSS